MEIATRVVTLLDVAQALLARKERLAVLEEELLRAQDRIEELQSDERALQSDQLAGDLTPEQATSITNRLDAILAEIRLQEATIAQLDAKIQLVKSECAELERYEHACKLVERGIRSELLARDSLREPAVETQSLAMRGALIAAAVSAEAERTSEQSRAKLEALAAENQLDPFALLMVTLFELVPGRRATSHRIMKAGEESGLFAAFGYRGPDLIRKRRGGWGGANTRFLQLISERNRPTVAPTYIRTLAELPWHVEHIFSPAHIRAFRRHLRGEKDKE